MPSRTVDRVNTGFAGALAIVAVVGIASVTSIYRFAQTTRELGRTHATLTQIQGMLLLLSDAERGEHGYVLTGDEGYLRPYDESVRTVVGQLDALREQTFADPAQQARLGALGSLATRRLLHMREIILLRQDGAVDAAVREIAGGRGRAVMDSIRSLTEAFERTEMERLAARDRSVARSARVALLIIAGGSLFAFLVVLGSAALIRRDAAERQRAERALRESETLLSQFMENLPIGVVVVDTESRLRFANNAAVDLAGPSVLLDTGERPLPLLRASDGAPYPDEETPIAGALQGRLGSLNDAALHSDGRAVPVEVSAAPIYDASGRIAYAIATFKDITERRRSEEALRAAKEAAETASRTKSDFLARMSHELRTPLNSVIGFANILLKNRAGNLGEQDVAYLERIRENGKHLLLLINDILDLSKIEAGKVEVEWERVDLTGLLNSVVAQLEAQTKNGAIDLRLQVPAGLEPLTTDPARLQQVLYNLIGNALKFTEQGHVEVRVEADAESDRVRRIVVEDTGIGIPAARLPAIFDAFEQAESTTARKYGGTGLGLPISRALCELLGYELTVRSEPGSGSVFSIDLEPPPAGPTDMAATGDAAEGPLVLIIDDEADSRVLLTHYMEEFGCRVVSSSSPASALDIARELQPDLITLDLMMPHLNGWDVLAELKRDAALAGIPVVVVSIIARESRASLLGALDIVQKPVERDALFDVLRRTVGPRPARVLVVEDSPDARGLLCDMLADHAAELRTAADGSEALDVLRDFDPELVITDLVMPGMDGMTFLELFRAAPRFQHVPVVVITARDLNADERERLERHTSAVLRKGNALEADLLRVLGAVLERRAAADRTAA